MLISVLLISVLKFVFLVTAVPVRGSQEQLRTVDVIVDGTMTEFSVIAPDSAGRFPDKVRVLARQFCRERNIHPHQECGRVLAERWHLKHDVVVGRNKEALPENLISAISSFANFLNNSSVFENRYQDRSFVNRYRTMFFDTSTCREEAKYVSQELKDSDGITLSSFDDIFFKRFGIRETSMYYYLMRELFLRMPPSVTVVITSCNRHNLLFNTISSFIKFNTWKHIQKMIIIEDCKISNEQAVSMESNVLSIVSSLFPVHIIFNDNNIGQIASIDKAYSFVETPYTFHLEDDWEFYNSGFIEESLNILNIDRNILMVNLGAHSVMNGHPIEYKMYMDEKQNNVSIPLFVQHWQQICKHNITRLKT